MQTLERPEKPARRSRKIPEALVYERWGGKPYYRRGYKDVLDGTKTPEEIRGTSGLQAEIVSYIHRILAQQIDHKKYRVHISEPGLHINRRENVSGDVLIWEKATYTPDKITIRYTDIPPLVAIEVDVKIDLEKTSDVDYVFDKARLYLGLGAQKVIWVLSNIEKVFVFRAGQEAEIKSWAADIEVLEGRGFNIGKYLDEEGIQVVR